MFVYCLGSHDVQQSPLANMDEQVDTQKRKELLLALLDIIDKKKMNDNVADAEAADQLVAADDTVSASSSGKQQRRKASSENIVSAASSVAYSRNPETKHNTEYKVKSVVEEPDFSDNVNLSSSRQSRVLSGRNSGLSSNSNQHKQPPEDADEKLPVHSRCHISSKRSIQPQMSQGIKRKSSVNDKSMLGPCRSSTSLNKHDVRVRCFEATLDSVPVQHITKMAVVNDCEAERSSDDLVSDEQVLVQGPENKQQDMSTPLSVPEQDSKVVVLQRASNERLSLTTEHLNDMEDPFAYSPPRKVRLKFRDGAGKTCGDSSELSTASTTDTVSSPANNRNSYSPPNSKQRKQSSEDAAENYKTDTKPPLLGRCPTASKRRLPPSMSQSPNRKFLADRKSLLGLHNSSASQSERAISKYSKESLVQTGLYSRQGKSDHSRCTDYSSSPRTYRRSSSKDFVGGKLKQVEERIQRLKSSEQEHHTPEFERERVFKTEQLWQQSPEEVAWQVRDGETWREDNTEMTREYHNRYREPFQEERVSDLRQKLNFRRQCMNRRYRDEEACRPGLLGDQPVNRSDDERRCLLRTPPQPHCDDVEDEYHNVYRGSERRRASSLLGDFPVPRHDVFLPDDDDDSWMNVDHRRWKLSLDEDPRHLWHGEVRQFSCLFRVC